MVGRWIHLCIDMQRMFAEDTPSASPLDAGGVSGGTGGINPSPAEHNIHALRPARPSRAYGGHVAVLL